MEILPASHSNEHIDNQSFNDAEKSIDAHPTSRDNTLKVRDEVDSVLQEYQPLLPSTQVESRPQRKPSTFVVTPVSIGSIQNQSVSNLFS